jgi:hypothetical protein
LHPSANQSAKRLRKTEGNVLLWPPILAKVKKIEAAAPGSVPVADLYALPEGFVGGMALNTSPHNRSRYDVG